jgi:hypothetical protein
MNSLVLSVFKRRPLGLSHVRTGSTLVFGGHNCHREASSFVRGAIDVPLLEHTFPRFFTERLLPEHSSGTALISTHEPARPHGGPVLSSKAPSSYLSWSFEDLDRHVCALSKGMLKLGVKKGDRVGVVMGNNRCISTRQFEASAQPFIVSLVHQRLCYATMGVR